MSGNDLEALVLEADQLAEKQEFDRAEELYLEAANKGEIIAFIKVGDLHTKRGYLRVAKKYYERAYQVNPYDPKIINELKKRGFTDFDLDSLIKTKKMSRSKNNKYNQLNNKKLMRKNCFSSDIEACAHTLWLVTRLLAVIMIIPSFILLFTSIEQKVEIFIYAILGAVTTVIGGWVAKTLIIGFGVIVRNNENQINEREQNEK